jgi:hypothetical protein
VTFRLGTWCLNQLRYRVSHNNCWGYIILCASTTCFQHSSLTDVKIRSYATERNWTTILKSLDQQTRKPYIYLLTYSWSWALLEEPEILQLLKNFPAFFGTRRFITVFTRALHWSLCVHFRNKVFFYGEELLAPHPTPKLEDHHLSAVRDCLFNIFAASLQNWRASPPSATWGRAMPWWQGNHSVEYIHFPLRRKKCTDTNQDGSRLKQTLNLLNRLTIIFLDILTNQCTF